MGAIRTDSRDRSRNVETRIGRIGSRYRFHEGWVARVGVQDGSIGARIKTTRSQNGSTREKS